MKSHEPFSRWSAELVICNKCKCLIPPSCKQFHIEWHETLDKVVKQLDNSRLEGLDA